MDLKFGIRLINIRKVIWQCNYKFDKKSKVQCQTPTLNEEDIETVVSEAEVLINSSNESDGIKKKELELKYDKLIRKLKDLEHQKEEVTDKRNKINTFISTLKKKANAISEFDEGLFNIMVDKAVVHRDKSIEFIFNSGYKVKVEARK